MIKILILADFGQTCQKMAILAQNHSFWEFEKKLFRQICLLYIRLAATLLRLCAIEILSINKPNGAGSLFHGTLVEPAKATGSMISPLSVRASMRP